MPATHQNLRALLAQGNLEAVLQALVQHTAHTDDADLRQRVLTLSGQFAALKKQHLTGLLDDKDYRLQLNRITAAAAEIVDSEADSGAVTQSHRLTPPAPRSSFWKKLIYLGLLVGILAGTVQVVDYVQKQQPAPVGKPAAEPPKADTTIVKMPISVGPDAQKESPAQKSPADKPVAQPQKQTNITVKDSAKVGIINTGDSPVFNIKQ